MAFVWERGFDGAPLPLNNGFYQAVGFCHDYFWLFKGISNLQSEGLEQDK